MALQKDLAFSNGLSCTAAYIKVFSVGGGKEKAVIEVSVAKDKTLSDTNNYIEKRYYNFTPSVLESAPNFIKQAYEYLKTLSEYTDAVDV